MPDKEELFMKKIVLVILLMTLATQGFASTHKES
jgi:hypothetical protein